MNAYRTGMAVAVMSGYVLGRRKKAGLALAVGTCLAARHLGLTPGRLLPQALGALQSPKVQDLADLLRGELLTASHTVVSAADRRLADISDALRDRADALAGMGAPGRRRYGRPDEQFEDEQYADDYAPDDGYREDGYESEEDGRYRDGDEDTYDERDDAYDDAYDDESCNQAYDDGTYDEGTYDEDRQGQGWEDPHEYDEDEPAGAAGHEPTLRPR
ncbi:hypothetical protein [Streptomyces spiralis]|uniref:hypothetical protein n=1 Tax=Streptomyces spiralis TaxID=66376 RepID=UPI0036ACD313